MFDSIGRNAYLIICLDLFSVVSVTADMFVFLWCGFFAINVTNTMTTASESDEVNDV